MASGSRKPEKANCFVKLKEEMNIKIRQWKLVRSSERASDTEKVRQAVSDEEATLVPLATDVELLHSRGLHNCTV